jgi:hypothetical protein
VRTQRLGLGTTESQHWVAIGAHSGKAGRTGAAQETKQHGLCLVVGGVAEQRPAGEHGVAGSAGASFKVGTVVDLHRPCCKCCTPVAADLGH